ncbi:MAG: hypothetical protein ACJA01_002729 [Saprospiraceae bacterium]|jgi:hypothetical protein
MNFNILFVLLSLIAFQNVYPQESELATSHSYDIYIDKPFQQEHSVKYFNDDKKAKSKKVYTDRNGVVKIISTQGLLQTHGGHFLYPGKLVPDNTYRTMAAKRIKDLILYRKQFVYLDNKAIFSNGWAGEIFYKHSLPQATHLVGGKHFNFLISGKNSFQYLENGSIIHSEELKEDILDLCYNDTQNIYYLLTSNSIDTYDPTSSKIQTIFKKPGLQSISLQSSTNKIVVGTNSGYLFLDGSNYEATSSLIDMLPATSITCIQEIDGNLWFGTDQGAFMLKEGEKYNYYYGERWLPDSEVIHISGDKKNGINILTKSGLSVLKFEEYTLADKARNYEKQVRERHLRLGFNATLTEMDKGNIASGYLGDSDNDGLWTSMYLAAEIFRYKVTQSEEALQNVRESFTAMERLYFINDIQGFPSRSYERSGYIDRLSDPHRWQHSKNEEWDWKATTSSDEAIGHIFAFSVLAELLDDNDLRSRAIHLIDILMGHIVRNEFYLVDYDGQPTQWGKWNPIYVNKRLPIVGDRKLNSSNIASMLQTAYYFTKKDIYKNKLLELYNSHGYLDNLMKPMGEVGKAPESADDFDKMLSESWNHSDDEMYFLGYWGMYRYPIDEALLPQYKETIVDHWNIERPEKDGLWNIITYITGNEDYDLDEAMWYLREYPLDLITWNMKNSHRKDIKILADNFRGQTTESVLPPDELPITRHNANRFRLDGGRDGTSEYSAGDIWLLPYWMGRYLGVISSSVR